MTARNEAEKNSVQGALSIWRAPIAILIITSLPAWGCSYGSVEGESLDSPHSVDTGSNTIRGLHPSAEEKFSEQYPTPEPEQTGDIQEPESNGRRKFDFLVYYGKFVRERFVDIITLHPLNYRPSYVGVIAINYKLGPFIGPLTLEAEWQLARHQGLQTHSETNALLIARLGSMGDGPLPVSLAVGSGISVASAEPKLEKAENETNPVLYYLMTEIDVGIPSFPRNPRMMLRIHHRSGVFGVFCPGICGSNFITYGLKFAF